ncbi:21436_t:CDS:2, partial [Gigaspora rosea]
WIGHDLLREWAVSDQKLKLDTKMMIDIPIQFINFGLLYENNINSRIDIDDQEIINEMTASIRKNSTIYIRISSNERNVGRKIKHVMVTFAILNDKNNIHCSDHHFILLLYPGNESYNILKLALSLLVAELEEIQSGFFDFTAFVKVIKQQKNSMDYCLWCSVKKTQNGILEINNIHQDNWTISKNIENLVANYTESPGCINKPLFLMISIQNWVVNRLHLMLRITGRLWTLVISKLKNTRRYNDETHQTISQEML